MMATVGTDALELLAENIQQQVQEGAERLDVERLMQLSPWSRRQMERLFRSRYLTSPARYFRDCQWDRAKRHLMEGEDILSTSTKTGFASLGRLHDTVVTRSGMTPGELRRRGEGVYINYGFFHTQLGITLIAATKRGMCALRLCGINPTAEMLSSYVGELSAKYPLAVFDENTVPLQTYADQLVAFLEARSASFCPELDILEGTTFQREVWAELQKVSPGEIITYGELAKRLGRPAAVRAVAHAVATNSLAIAIPCHRCLRADGTLEGYRWGIEWKQRLLALESERKTG